MYGFEVEDKSIDSQILPEFFSIFSKSSLLLKVSLSDLCSEKRFISLASAVYRPTTNEPGTHAYYNTPLCNA